LQRKGVAPSAPRTRHLPPRLRLGKQNNISLKRTLHVYYDALLIELKRGMSAQVADLKHKEIGYRAVISYLQARLDGNAEL
jgi:hypothetical protein